jgi:hypothetical protein
MSSVEGLTPEESASIHLYTMENQPSSSSFYGLLNAALRNEDRDSLKPYFAYLKLILTALFKTPSVKGVFWRGVRADLIHQYPKGKRVTWWGFR